MFGKDIKSSFVMLSLHAQGYFRKDIKLNKVVIDILVSTCIVTVRKNIFYVCA